MKFYENFLRISSIRTIYLLLFAISCSQSHEMPTRSMFVFAQMCLFCQSYYNQTNQTDIIVLNASLFSSHSPFYIRCRNDFRMNNNNNQLLTVRYILLWHGSPYQSYLNLITHKTSRAHTNTNSLTYLHTNKNFHMANTMAHNHIRVLHV